MNRIGLLVGQNLSAFFEALKGGMSMSLLLTLTEWSIISVVFYFVIKGWLKGGKEPKGSQKRTVYRIVDPIALGVPAGIFAITLLLNLDATLGGWILKWTVVLGLIYGAARYFLWSSYWIDDEEVAAMRPWKIGNGKKEDEKIEVVDLQPGNWYWFALWFKRVVRAKGNPVSKEFILGALSKEEKDGKGLSRTLLAKTRFSICYRLVSLRGLIRKKWKIEDLDREVKREFLSVFRTVLRQRTLEGNLNEQDEIGKSVLQKLDGEKKFAEWEIRAESAHLLEISIDNALYRAQNELSLMDMENEEVYEKIKVGEKIKSGWAGKGVQKDLKGFVLEDRRIVEITTEGNIDQKEEVVEEQKLEMITKNEWPKKVIHLLLVGTIILFGIIPLGFIGYSKFGPASKQEASVESVVPAANTTIPANPSGPNGTVDSPLSQYHVPGLRESPLLWGAVAVLVAFLVLAAVAKLSKRNSEWIGKYGKWIFRGCGAMIFFGMLMQPYVGLMGSGVLILVIGLFIYIGARKNRMAKAVDGMIGLILFYIIVLQLFIPMGELVTKVNQPGLYKLYEEQIKKPVESGKAWEDFKRLFNEPQSQVSNETFGVPSQPVVRPETVERPKQVVQQIIPKRIERIKIRKFRISARRSWTYIADLKGEGELIRITAEGSWDGSGGQAPEPDLLCGAEGIRAPDWIDDMYRYPLAENRMIHNLIGRIGGKVFHVGENFEQRNYSQGGFYLGINDYIVRDNDGSLDVTIEVER